MSLQPDVVYEDHHLLVVNKPAGVVVQGASENQESLAEIVKAYLKEKYAKPGNVYLGIVSRLDAPVTGLVPLARTSKAADRLAAQFREGTVLKVYSAIVEGTPPPQAEFRDFLFHDDAAHCVIVSNPQRAGAKEAVLRVLDRRPLAQGRTHVMIELITGRKHQIRVQFAARGTPILGDLKYGSRTSLPRGTIALHARRLELNHPTTKERLAFEAPPPNSWKQWGA